MTVSRLISRALVIALMLPGIAISGPAAEPGDVGLRHDIQILADYGAISGPVTTWPISWDAVLADLERVKADDVVLPNAVMPTFERLLARAQRETGQDEWRFRAYVSAAEEPMNIRGFADTPRGDGEIGGGVSWGNDLLQLDLNARYVDNPADGEEARLDGSQVAVELGNWSVAASTLDRWWGPGWDGSLILSNTARPIPSITVGRNLTAPFETKWLSWMGPWDFEVMFGQLEEDRAVPNAQFFGMRLNFKPTASLEIGLSRSAQWCGDDRPCGFDTFFDLLIGRDNVGDDGIDADNEPGNQMAGFDVRWTNMWFRTPVAFYGQMIGEDEAGGFPSRYLAQFGVEGSGFTRGNSSYRWYLEGAATSCDAVKGTVLYGCAYRNGIYRSGYTHEGRIIGHALDNDARVISAGLVLADVEANTWQVVARFGELNRVGGDSQHTVAVEPQDIASVDVMHSRFTRLGLFEVGIGWERREINASNLSDDDARGYIRWTSR